MDFTTYEPRISALEAGGGGGGDSDFSTATVTLINSDAQNTYFNISPLPVLTEWEGQTYLEVLDIGVYDEATTNVILYKGSAKVSLSEYDEQTPPIIEGSATYDEDQLAFIVTGECTITVKGTGETM